MPLPTTLSAVTDVTITLSDVTTNNASTSKHGFLKKLDNDASHFMNGQGNWAAATGDMAKATYDPQNAGKISGASSGGNAGGNLTMSGGSGGVGGSIDTAGGTGGAGGIIQTNGGSGAGGGSIDTHGDTAAGGRIWTYGTTNPGGDIFTHDGGGDIDTRSTGTIQLGVSGTRTTFNGNATGDRNFTLPNNSAACFAVQADSSWIANADAGDKTEVIPNAGDVATVAGLIDADYTGAGALIIAMAEKIKALETALVSKLVPNA